MTAPRETDTRKLKGAVPGCPRPGAGRGYFAAGYGSAGSPRAQRLLLSLLCAFGIVALLLTSGCASTTASNTTPERAWDNSEIMRAGRWAG